MNRAEALNNIIVYSGTHNNVLSDSIAIIKDNLEILDILLKYRADKYIMNTLPDHNSDYIKLRDYIDNIIKEYGECDE